MIEGHKFWRVSYKREKRYPKDCGTMDNYYSKAEEVVHHIFKSQKTGGSISYRDVYDEPHGLYFWKTVATTESFLDWLKTEPELLGKEKGYWAAYVKKVESAAHEGRFRIYSTHRKRLTTSRVTPPEPIRWPREVVEEKGTPAFEAAIFRIADIPDDWDLQLSKAFTDKLDEFNRPWKHDPQLPRGRCIYWESGWLHDRTTSQMPPDILAGYKNRLAVFERLWGRHRFKDHHFKDGDPRQKVDTGGWILGSQLKLIREHLDIADADLSQYITGIRKGKASENTRHEIKSLMPIRPDENWARLFGLYFSGGSINARRRYITDHYKKKETPGYYTRGGTYDAISFRIRMQEDVAVWAIETLAALHSDAATHNPMKSAVYLKRKKLERNSVSRRTKTLPTMLLSWPELLIMQKMGLPELDKKPSGKGSRTVRPRIPDWIKENDSFMKAFVEGYMNGPSASVHITITKIHTLPYTHLYQRIVCYGTPLEDVESFIGDIANWLRSKGLNCRLHKKEGYTKLCPGQYRFELTISKAKDIQWLSENLEIVKADSRAALLLRLEALSDPFIYEAIREIKPGPAFVLGSLLEEKQTVDELAYSLPMSRVAVVDALKRLQLRGLVAREGADYVFKIDRFRDSVLTGHIVMLERLKKRRARYSTKLLHQCAKCHRIYLVERSTCGLCGGDVAPVFRDKTLRSLRHSEAYLEKLIVTLRMAK